MDDRNIPLELRRQQIGDVVVTIGKPDPDADLIDFYARHANVAVSREELASPAIRRIAEAWYGRVMKHGIGVPIADVMRLYEHIANNRHEEALKLAWDLTHPLARASEAGE